MKPEEQKEAPPVRSTEILVRAVIAGAITPEEAIILWHRIRKDRARGGGASPLQ